MLKKGNKFGAKKTVYKGVTYDSKKEAERAMTLEFMVNRGEIAKFELQPKFDIIINEVKVCRYIADFKVFQNDGSVVIEDVKGLKKGSAYQVFKLKQKLMKAVHNIDVIEI